MYFFTDAITSSADLEIVQFAGDHRHDWREWHEARHDRARHARALGARARALDRRVTSRNVARHRAARRFLPRVVLVLDAPVLREGELLLGR